MLTGKNILITGATSGIGKAAALNLASEGCRIIFTARDETKAQDTRGEIIRKSGNGDIHYILGDLSGGRGVRKIADEYSARFEKLDILLNNAGGYFHHKKITADGYEYTFALNHLGYFALTLLLLERIRKSAPARIVNVASEASRIGHIDFNDLMAAKKYSGIKAYCQSKLANLLFTYELARRLDGSGITVNAIHPGTVRTNFGNDASGLNRFFFNLYIPFMRKPEKGAETLAYLAKSDLADRVTGKYFYNLKPIRSVKESYNRAVSERLWEKSLELTGLSSYDIR